MCNIDEESPATPCIGNDIVCFDCFKCFDISFSHFSRFISFSTMPLQCTATILCFGNDDFTSCILQQFRSEERRVGKECRIRWAPYTTEKRATKSVRQRHMNSIASYLLH